MASTGVMTSKLHVVELSPRKYGSKNTKANTELAFAA